MHNRIFGQLGERLAERYLTELGARVLARNFRIPYGEIDLLLEHDGDLVAVEVKLRSTLDLEKPEEAFNSRQFSRIALALTTYAIDSDFVEMPWRIDAVAIEVGLDGRLRRLDHFRSVYPA